MRRTASARSRTRPARAALLGLACLQAGCGGSSGGADDAGTPATSADDPPAGQDAGEPVPTAVGGPLDEQSPERPPALPAPYVNGFVEVEETISDGEGFVFLRASKSIDTERDLLIERGENVPGEFTWVSEIAYDDEDGSLTRSTYTASDGFSNESVYEHDGRGLVVRRTGTDEFSGGDTVIEYDERGRQTVRRGIDAFDGSTTFVRRFSYGADGFVAGSTSTYVGVPDPDPAFDIPTSVASATYAHDAAGRMTGFDVDDGDDGGVDTLYRYEYDADGNMVRLTITGADGALVETREYRYEAVDEPIYNRWIRVLASFL